jgi:lipopolysaccharide biosynthesis regulator YciM
MLKQLLFVLLSITTGTAMAQSIDEAQQFLYYDRLNSAEATVKQVIQKDPNNTEAYYWLFQTKLQQGDTAAAKQVLNDVYKLQQANDKLKIDPLFEAARVHMYVINGNKTEAQTKSEEVVKDTKGKNAEVLKALAKAQIDAKQGEGNYDYALELLDKAAKREKKDPGIFKLMGDAWRRKGDGGNAVSFYQQAIAADPSYARANYDIGKIYVTQNNQSIYVKHFTDAIKQDPAFSPAYYELYYHYYFRDVNEAKNYLDKYIANSDKTVDNDYMLVDLLYVSRKNQEAIDMANKLLQQQGSTAKPRLYKLIAYSYAAMGDSTKALEHINTYFEKEKPNNYVAKDYALKADLIDNKKDSAANQEAITLWEKAIVLDTLPANKVDYMKQVANMYKQQGERSREAYWLGKVFETKKDPSNLDLYYWGLAHYAAAEYKQADTVFGLYSEKYPDHLHGYLWRAKANAVIDSTMENGLALPYYTKVIELADDDAKTNKSILIQAYGYIGAYQANVKKDFPVALENFEKILQLDPGNADATKYIGILKKWIQTGSETTKASSGAGSDK